LANVADHLFRQERERGDKRALVFEGQAFSFGEIAERVRRTAGGLSAMGVEIGGRVGLMVTSQPEFIFFEQAIFALGAIVCPLNIFYRKSELAHAIACCDIEFLVIERAFLDRLPEPSADGASTLRRVMVLGLEKGEDSGVLCSAAALAQSGTPLREPVSVPLSAVALMLNTSATTGKSKGVMLSIANIRANYDATPGWLGIEERSVTLCALPLYNTFGLNQGINATMVAGATLVLMPRFDPAKCLKAIEDYGCTFFPAVPTMLQRMFEHPDVGQRNLTSIERIMTGAAPVPAALLERIYAAMGPDTSVITGYGLTEATAIVSLERIELDSNGKVRRPKSIGRVVPGIEMQILSENGAPAPVGTVGEICVRGPSVALGYYKMPEETALAIVDGWLHTGDLGLIDADGYAFIVDRKKDVIIRGGQNIYPADIEEVLYRFDGVSEVAVIGVPDDSLGEVPVAYVALQTPGSLRAEQLIARCKEELAYYKVPAAVHFLPELPKGPTGKILRRGLRAQ
jgi:long-chain acyl-CoA synthetase